MRLLVTSMLALVISCSASDDRGSSVSSVDVDGGAASTFAVAPTFTFESGPVRPLALTPDNKTLFVANTANGSLDVFTVGGASGVTLAGSTFVGIDPVAVAARTPTEAWVVNRVSDSVSVVDASTMPPRVVRTILVGDDPSDVVFAGSGNAQRAFVTTAHRGQRRSDAALAAVPGAGDPLFTTAGVGRADVWVFDALSKKADAVPLRIVTLFGDTPRALAVTPDGATVYAAIFESGNQTTATNSSLPCAGFDDANHSSPCVKGTLSVPGAPPGPATSFDGHPGPAVSVNLAADASGKWRDVLGRDWSSLTEFSLPDQDVFAIDASTLAVRSSYRHVGTTLFAMAVNPQNGKVYVTNTQARNDLRFEGPGTFAGTTLQGHIAESRVSVLDASSSVKVRYLDKHIDYSVRPAPPGTANHSLSLPGSVVVDKMGTTMYVAAFGSSKIGVFPTQAIENDTFDPVTASNGYITVSGGGPSGIALDEANNRLYVTTRFDDGLAVIDLATKKEIAHVALANPEPDVVKNGRSFLYDARKSSSNGEASCASCHTFGDKDNLAWDLGNPDGTLAILPSTYTIKLSVGAPGSINGGNGVRDLHPNKGPMTTQTLRGMVNHGPMHWRGDRITGAAGTDTTTTPPYDSNLAFRNFIVAFTGLLGRATDFDDSDMQTFASFALDIVMPPNPVRALDDSLTTSQANGRRFFMGCADKDSATHQPVVCGTNGLPIGTGHLSDGFVGTGFTCQGCHTLDASQGFFGTNGQASFDAVPQTMKIPQLRNLYDKIGMFGMPAVPIIDPGNNGFLGDQVRGTGFEHDGSVDTIFRFLHSVAFDPQGDIGFTSGDAQRRDVEQFLLAFDGDLAPIVGQQATLDASGVPSVTSRVDLLIARAKAAFVSKIVGGQVTECDLVARAVIANKSVVFHMRPDGTFQENGGAIFTDAQVRALATTPGQEVTYTCLPPGWVH